MFQPYPLSPQILGKAETACPKVLNWVIYNPFHFHKIEMKDSQKTNGKASRPSDLIARLVRWTKRDSQPLTILSRVSWAWSPVVGRDLRDTWAPPGSFAEWVCKLCSPCLAFSLHPTPWEGLCQVHNQFWP